MVGFLKFICTFEVLRYRPKDGQKTFSNRRARPYLQDVLCLFKASDDQFQRAGHVHSFRFHHMPLNGDYKNVEITWSDNHFYPSLPNSGNSWNWAYPKPASGNFTGEPSKITAETENPLTTCMPSTGTFVLGSAYAGWGSSLVPVE